MEWCGLGQGRSRSGFRSRTFFSFTLTLVWLYSSTFSFISQRLLFFFGDWFLYGGGVYSTECHSSCFWDVHPTAGGKRATPSPWEAYSEPRPGLTWQEASGQCPTSNMRLPFLSCLQLHVALLRHNELVTAATLIKKTEAFIMLFLYMTLFSCSWLWLITPSEDPHG